MHPTLVLNQSEKRGNPEEMNRSLRVLDGLIQNISSVRTVSEDTAINVAINKLISNMSTDDMYQGIRRCQDISKNSRRSNCRT